MVLTNTEMDVALREDARSLLDLNDDLLARIGHYLIEPRRQIKEPSESSVEIIFEDETQDLRAIRATCRRLRQVIKLRRVNLRLT